MVEPEVIHRVAGAALLGGVMVLFGAGYAICHALAGLTRSRRMAAASLLSYALLCASTAGFAALLQLTGWWLALMGLLLIGYFVAPRFIWKLSLAVHGETPPGTSTPSPTSTTTDMEASRHD